MPAPIRVGAVIYDPRVVVIWDIIKDFFQAQDCPMDYVFYSNYELLVETLLAGHVQIAWNSPLAWIDAQRQTGGTCRAVAMRDTDRDRVTHLIVRQDSALATLADLRGKTVATGAHDSPQATLLPLHLLHTAGLEPARDFTVRRFDLMVGKHGDHIGGEQAALRSLQAGESDAAAVLDLNWTRWTGDGTASPHELRVLATTHPFDHCNFTVLAGFPPDDLDRWLGALFSMTYDNPAHREMMDLEGLHAWLPGRTSGYADLTAAVAEQHFFADRPAPAASTG
ncbi:MAG TPA: PhnD/SsuA/transferrin family substrate-binding protein [Chloroflexia bacterium]|nr:PhnD/SsuA/transferrin family substrate-binding protein [Chloroflexia bacterium]